MIPDNLIAIMTVFIVVTMIVGGLFKLFRPKMRSLIDTRKLSKKEQLAFLEAAIMTLYIDGVRETSEEIAFRSSLKHTEWNFNVDKEVSEIRIKAIRALHDPQEMKTYLNQIKEKLSNDEIANLILIACSDLSDFGGYTGRIRECRFLAKLGSILRPGIEHSRIDL